jgi:tetratricopeptide (TPR) repeat protein
MNKVITILALSISQFCYSQAKWDSLVYALKDTDRNTKQYGKILVDLCWKIAELDADSAIYYGEMVWDLDKKSVSDSIIARAYISLSAAYSYKGDHHKAIEMSYEGLEISQSIGDTRSEIDAANNIGIDFYYLGDFQNAQMYFQRQIDLAKSIDDQKQLGNIYNNLAMIEAELDNHSTEMTYYDSAIACFKKINAERDYANALVNRCASLDKFDQYSEVIKLLTEAKEIFIRLHCMADLTALYSFWAEVELKQKNYDLAEKLILESLLIAEENNQDLQTQLGYKTAYHIYEAHGDFKQAYYYFKRFHESFAAARENEKTQAVASMREQYETSLKEQQIEHLQQQNEIETLRTEQAEKKSLLFLFGFIAFGSIALTIAVFYFQKTKNQRNLNAKNQELISLNHTKDRLFSIISHDLKSPLFSFHTITKSLTEHWDKIEKDALKSYIESLRD